MKKVTYFFLALTAMVLLYSCVSSKKLKASEEKYSRLELAYQHAQNDLKDCLDNLKNKDSKISDYSNQNTEYEKRINDLKNQIDFLKENNNIALNRLQDLSVITETQAKSIKKSLDNLGMKDLYINDLKRTMAFKDSLNNLLVNNLKSALIDINDKDINIKVEKDVVYVDISDKLLFNSGSYDVTPRAKEVLGKVARVLKAHPELEFLVEGNTDTKPFKNGLLLDNWDLSTKRATAVTRVLQYNYHLDPRHITAAGRGEYMPVDTNETAEGRALNRRTRIIILPQLDQFFKLLEKK